MNTNTLTNTTEIEYFITGWEADNDHNKNYITAQNITEYINLINTTKTTTQAVYTTIVKLNQNHNHATAITEYIKTQNKPTKTYTIN